MTPSNSAQRIKNKIRRLLVEYDAVQSQLEMIDEDEVDNRINFEETFITISVKIRELLNTPAQVNTESNPSNPRGTADSPS